MRSYFVWLGIFAAFSLAIYDIKYSVKTERKRTYEMEAELMKERKLLHILEVEWAMLSRPERIQALAAKHLPMLQVSKVQFLNEDDALWRVSHQYNSNDANKPIHQVNQLLVAE